MRNIIPSLPINPTVAEAAITLWMATMFPAAAPTLCAATINAPDNPNKFAVSNWNWLNIRLLTVFDPARKAPTAPIVGANIGYMLPIKFDIPWAIAIGILIKLFEFIPEFIIILTNGTVNKRTKPAPRMVFDESKNAIEILLKLMRWIKNVIIQTKINTPPGKYKIWKLALIFSSLSIFSKLKLNDLRKLVKGLYVLEIIRTKAKKKYGNQALIVFIVFDLFNGISIPPFHETGQSEEEGKFQESFGIKKFFFIENVTIARPTKPPIMDGNSGPRKVATIK